MIGKMSRTAVALIAASVGILSAAPLAMGAPASMPQSPTSFAFGGQGYAARVDGGSLPANAGRVALATVGCTNQAGVSHWGKLATLNLPGLGTLNGMQTHAFTTTNAALTSSWTVQKAAGLDLLNIGNLGQLSLTGISSITHAYHDSSGYHATTKAGLAKITLTIAGIPINIPVPPVGQTVNIPGLANITLGAGTTKVTNTSASADLDAIKIEIIPLNVTVWVGHAQSRIAGGVRSALFRGGAYGASANAGTGVLKLGKTPNLPMSCQGTGGHVKSTSTAGIQLGDLAIGALAASDLGKSTTTGANMWAEGDVASLDWPTAGLSITGIEAHASAVLRHGVVTTSTAGTSDGTIILNGQVYDLPLGGTLTIPGIASITSDVETQFNDGVSVVALQISLLDGTGAVIDLGYAKAQIFPSGL